MEIEIDYTKTGHENAGEYYDRAKKLLQKKEGAAKAVKDLTKSLEEAQKKAQEKIERKIISLKREWYESFHWFRTSENLLVIGGRDAHQNEILNSRYFTDADLFFHADIFGASVCILKEGAKSGTMSREEAAGFAACYSSAWKEGLKNIDVYEMRREQVSKSTGKGSLGTGSFLLKGEREWHRNMQLELVFFIRDGMLNVAPKLAFDRLGLSCDYVQVMQGEDKKSDAAKKVAKALGYLDLDYVMRQLPAGSFSISVKKRA